MADGIGACDELLLRTLGLVNNAYRSYFNRFILFMVREETVMLYDPNGNSEDGIIVLFADNKTLTTMFSLQSGTVMMELRFNKKMI